jgi:NADH:ubiquinone oxidoreductase subunit 6 (subunit J)
MNFSFVLFYTLSAIILVSAAGVISSQNPVHSVLFLVVVFRHGAGVLMLIGAEFLSLIFIVVYVGAIAVLFLFVVMIRNIKLGDYFFNKVYQYLPIGAFVGFIFFLELLIALYFQGTPLSTTQLNRNTVLRGDWFSIFDGLTNIELFGQLIYTYYFVYFLIAGLILLVAIIGAIVLTIQPKNPETGINVVPFAQQVYQQTSRSVGKSVFMSSRL